MYVVIRLTRKLAERIDGIDISGRTVGDVFQLPWQSARLLIAEGWAEIIERRRKPRLVGDDPYGRRLT
jgi:hypothetical protein